MKLNIKSRIAIAFALMSLLLVACGAAGYYGTRLVTQALEETAGPVWQAADGVAELRAGVHRQSALTARLLAGGERGLVDRIEDDRGTLGAALRAVDASGVFDATTVGALAADIDAFTAAQARLIDAHQARRGFGVADAGTTPADNALEQAAGALLARLSEMDTAVEGRMAQAGAAAAGDQALGIIVFTAIAGVLIAVATFALINTTILSHLRRIASQIHSIADGEGDLTHTLDDSGDDELSEVARSFNRFSNRVRELVTNIHGSTDQVATAAEELTAITNESSRGVNRQHEEVEHLATAMNQMVSTVQEVARNASQAASAAQEANDQANSGNQVVTRTIRVIEALANDVKSAGEVIQRLEKDSENIGAVLDVIRNIAEQTNLLALNAAIEAARAGEQGRGFAVVADEVRTLASRTQDSTREIQEMIERLQTGTREAVQVMERGRSQTEETVTQAGQAGEALTAITRSVGSITDMNTQIATAAEEQSSVAEEVNRNIYNLSEMADQNGQSSRQTADASEELSRLAVQLQQVVAQFKTS